MSQVESKSTQRELKCAKCGHSNSGKCNHCTKCGARMYIRCHSCGHSSLRAEAKCSECGQQLHRSPWKRLQRKIFGGKAGITPFQIFLLLVFTLITYRVIVFLAEFRFRL
jgi:predicted RNA-binding Zn-ribbon protein involved in translation (DUF1610 family)